MDTKKLRLLKEALTSFKPVLSENLSSAQVVVTEAYGENRFTPGLGNEFLAELTASLCKRYGIPAIPQGEVGQCLKGRVYFLGEVPRQRFAKRDWGVRYISTADVAEYDAQICREYGISRVILVADPFHFWRARQELEDRGLSVLVPPGLVSRFDRRSTQFFCKSKWFFVPAELGKRIEYVIKN